eukprot:SAG31_NODE_42300_length_272_cov_0.601156_1_plen_41_part_01
MEWAKEFQVGLENAELGLLSHMMSNDPLDPLRFAWTEVRSN